MRFWTMLLVGILLVLGTTAVLAVGDNYVNMNGATGVVTLSTAEIAALNSVNLAVAYRPRTDENVTTARVNVGIAKNTELWAGYQWWDNEWNDRVWNVGAKYRFLTQDTSGVDLAIGVGYHKNTWDSDWVDEEHATTAFLAVSKDLIKEVPANGVQVRGTAGVQYQRFEEDDWDFDFTKPYVALEIIGTQGWNLGLEYRWKDNDWDEKAPFSAVLRYQVPDQPLWFELGTTNSPWIGWGEDTQKTFFGVGYAFSTKK
jgi:hypothetical protein